MSLKLHGVLTNRADHRGIVNSGVYPAKTVEVADIREARWILTDFLHLLDSTPDAAPLILTMTSLSVRMRGAMLSRATHRGITTAGNFPVLGFVCADAKDASATVRDGLALMHHHSVGVGIGNLVFDWT